MKILAALALYLCITTAQADLTDDAEAAYKRGDYATALQLYRSPAEQGDAFAQFTLGFMYDMGHGVLQDYAEAMKWYRLAAEQGHAKSQRMLGLMYGTGQGVPQDFVESHKWFKLAVGCATDDDTRIRATANRDVAAYLVTLPRTEGVR